MSKTKIIAIVTAAVVCTLGAGAFFLVRGIDAGITTSPNATASTPHATSASVDADEAKKDDAEKATTGRSVGDELTAEQAAAVSKNFEGSAIAYKTTAGTFIFIDRTQPLPESVKADAGAKATAAAAASANAGNTLNGDVEKFQKTLAYETGHAVILVARVYTVVDADTSAKGWTWMSSVGKGQMFSDAASAVAASQAQADATGATIIVSQ